MLLVCGSVFGNSSSCSSLRIDEVRSSILQHQYSKVASPQLRWMEEWGCRPSVFVFVAMSMLIPWILKQRRADFRGPGWGGNIEGIYGVLLRWENWWVWFKDTVQVNENSRFDLDMQRRFMTDVEKPEMKAGWVEVEIESWCCDLPVYTASRFGWFPLYDAIRWLIISIEFMMIFSV